MKNLIIIKSSLIFKIVNILAIGFFKILISSTPVESLTNSEGYSEYIECYERTNFSKSISHCGTRGIVRNFTISDD